MRAICQQCNGRGAVRSFDPERKMPMAFGLCTCDAGKVLRQELADAVENRAQGSEAQQPIEQRFGCSIDRIWLIEDLVETGQQTNRAVAPLDDDALLAEASRVGERAGLSGKAARR